MKHTDEIITALLKNPTDFYIVADIEFGIDEYDEDSGYLYVEENVPYTKIVSTLNELDIDGEEEFDIIFHLCRYSDEYYNKKLDDLSAEAINRIINTYKNAD